jgi:hypothetical protein
MSRKKNIYLEDALLRDLDQIVHKLGELNDTDYSQWSVKREDLIRFALASTYGLAFPYVNTRKHRLKSAIRKIKKEKK